MNVMNDLSDRFEAKVIHLVEIMVVQVVRMMEV